MSKSRGGAISFPGTDVTVPVPDDPEGEDEAVAAAFDQLVASGQWAPGREPPIPAEELYREFGYTPPTRRQRARAGPKVGGQSGNIRVRMPKKLHQELVQQAEREGVSLNTLIVTYLAREAGMMAERTAAS